MPAQAQRSQPGRCALQCAACPAACALARHAALGTADGAIQGPNKGPYPQMGCSQGLQQTDACFSRHWKAVNNALGSQHGTGCAGLNSRVVTYGLEVVLLLEQPDQEGGHGKEPAPEPAGAAL